jgi:hypothetical protein
MKIVAQSQDLSKMMAVYVAGVFAGVGKVLTSSELEELKTSLKKNIEQKDFIKNSAINFGNLLEAAKRDDAKSKIILPNQKN